MIWASGLMVMKISVKKICKIHNIFANAVPKTGDSLKWKIDPLGRERSVIVLSEKLSAPATNGIIARPHAPILILQTPTRTAAALTRDRFESNLAAKYQTNWFYVPAIWRGGIPESRWNQKNQLEETWRRALIKAICTHVCRFKMGSQRMKTWRCCGLSNLWYHGPQGYDALPHRR